MDKQQVCQHETITPSISLRQAGKLQRKCACGNHTVAGGECAECRRKRLQCKAVDYRAETAVPSIVHEVLRSPGHALDSATRAIIEPGFGYDFSQVRVHTNAQAARSARAMNALAYTVGNDIAFAENQYAPEAAYGRRLLAHELTHVIQQQGVNTSMQHFSPEETATQDVRLEQEADRAAEQVVAGQQAQVVGSTPVAAPQRQDKDKKNQPQTPKIVPPLEPGKAQKKLIDQARNAAAIRTQTAMFKASGIQGAVQFQEARRLAQIKFDWPNPNMEQISEVLSGMGGGLVTVDVKVAAANDPECAGRAGYVRGHRPPIVLCPGFFKDPANNEGRVRTMIHEMAHIKGIGKADVGEQYFPVFDCTSKGVFESADSWANYVHCLSGQSPDKPDEIVVPGGGSKPGKKSLKKDGSK